MAILPVNQELLLSTKQSSIRGIFKLSSKRQQSKRKLKTVDLGLGSPYGEPPIEFRRKLIERLSEKNIHHYMDNAGFTDVRKVVAEHLVKRGFFPKNLHWQDITMAAGASGGINSILKAIINPGDEVIILAPHFADFPSYVYNHQGKPVIVNLPAPSFNLDVNTIEKFITKKTKCIIVNTPNNPTGKIYTKNEIDQLHNMLIKKGKTFKHPIYLISDEPYREIIYKDAPFPFHISPATNYPYSFMVYSFSKSLCLPGERIGYIAMHPSMKNKIILRELLSVATRKLGFTNAPSLMQKTIKTLLNTKPNINTYLIKRDIICNVLRNLNYEFNLPEGTFYVFVKFPEDKDRFIKLTQEKGLFIIPGDAFGQKDYFRITYSRENKLLVQAGKIFTQVTNILSQH